MNFLTLHKIKSSSKYFLSKKYKVILSTFFYSVTNWLTLILSFNVLNQIDYINFNLFFSYSTLAATFVVSTLVFPLLNIKKLSQLAINNVFTSLIYSFILMILLGCIISFFFKQLISFMPFIILYMCLLMLRDFITRFFYMENNVDLIGGFISLVFVLSLTLLDIFYLPTLSINKVFSIIIVSLLFQLTGLFFKLKIYGYKLRLIKNIQKPKVSGFANWSILTSKNILIVNSLALYTPTLIATNVFFYLNLFGPFRQIIPLGINLFGHKSISSKINKFFTYASYFFIAILFIILFLDKSNYIIHGLFLIICDLFFIYSTFALFKANKLEKRAYMIILIIPFIISYLIMHFIFSDNIYSLYLTELTLLIMCVLISYKNLYE